MLIIEYPLKAQEIKLAGGGLPARIFYNVIWNLYLLAGLIAPDLVARNWGKLLAQRRDFTGTLTNVGVRINLIGNHMNRTIGGDEINAGSVDAAKD